MRSVTYEIHNSQFTMRRFEGICVMCGFCRGNLEIGTMEYIEKVDNNILIVKDVPCEKCEQCGEAFFSTSAVKVIERIMDSIQHISSEISLTVIDYNKNVA